MTNCPRCHHPVDGLVCIRCRPPIDPAVKAKIDAALAKWRRPRDPEAAAERAAIQAEGGMS